MEFPREEYWSELPFPTPGDLPDPGVFCIAGRFFTVVPPGKPLSLSLTFFFNHFCACFALFAFSSSWNSAFVYFDFDSFVFNCLISFWDFHFCFLFWMYICFFGAFLLLLICFCFYHFSGVLLVSFVFNHSCLLIFVFTICLGLFVLTQYLSSFFPFLPSCAACSVWFPG